MRLPRSVWLLGWVSFLTDTATEMVYPLLPLFLTRVLGAGALSLGVIEGLAEAANSILKILSGRVADLTGAPKRLVVAGYGISSAVRPLIALALSWSHVLAIRLTDRVGKGIRTAPRDAMLAAFAHPASRGKVFGFHRAMDHAGAVFGPLLASAFLYANPGEYRALFGLTAIPGILVMLVLYRVPEIRAWHPRSVPGDPASPRHDPAPAPSNMSPAFYKAMSVILLFSLGNASDAFLLLRFSDLGVEEIWLPFLWSAIHVVKSASSFVAGDLSDRLGRRKLMGAGWLVCAGTYVAFGTTESVSALTAVFLAYGLYFGLTEGVEKAWVADLAPAAARGTAFGIHNALRGAGALGASVLFGVIWTQFSPSAAFYTGAGFAAAATVLLYLICRAGDGQQDRMEKA